MTSLENAVATVVAALLALLGVILGMRAARATAQAGEERARRESGATDQARFLDSVLAEVVSMRAEAQLAMSRVDRIGAELEQSRRDNLECIRERDALKGRVTALEGRIDELEKRQRRS